jgi:hypothetical protein
MKNFLYLIFLSVFISCNTQNENNKEQIKTDTIIKKQDTIKTIVIDNFNDYVQAIPVLSKNFIYDTELDLDTIYDIVSKFRPDGSSIIGRLKTINQFYPIIYGYPADIFLPILEIYNSEGIKTQNHDLLDYSWCYHEFEGNYGRFIIIDDSTLLLQNYTIEEQDTIIKFEEKLQIDKLIM